MFFLYFAYSNHMTSDIAETFISLCLNYAHICLHVSIKGQFRSACFIDNQNIKGVTNRQRNTMREGHNEPSQSRNSSCHNVGQIFFSSNRFIQCFLRLNLCFWDNSIHWKWLIIMDVFCLLWSSLNLKYGTSLLNH